MDDNLKENLTAKQTWLRGLFILLFGFLLAIARVVLWAVVLIQFLFSLFTGKVNEKLLSFSGSLCRFIYQCVLFVTFNTDEKPFPFDDWPSDDEGTGKVENKSPAKKKAAKKSAVRKSVKKKAAATATDQASAPAQGEGGESAAPDKPES